MIALVVLVMALGGPHGQKPAELANGRIEVARGSQVLATSDVGNLELRLPRGSYRLTASLAGQRCQTRTVALRSSTEARLYCAVP